MSRPDATALAATDRQRRFVARIIGRTPAADLTREDAGHVIGGYMSRHTRRPHPHELVALARARGEQRP